MGFQPFTESAESYPMPRVESICGAIPYPVQLPEGVDTVTKGATVKLNGV